MTKKNTHQTEHGSDAPVEEKAIIDSTEVETGTADNQAATMQNGEKNDRTSDAKPTAQQDKEPADINAVKAEDVKTEPLKTETVVVKKGGSGLALLAILIALGLGGAGYYFGQQQVGQIQQKLTALEQQAESKTAAPVLPEMPSFDQERAQLAQLTKDYQLANNKIDLLEKQLSAKDQAYAALQAEVNKISSKSAAPAQPNDWLLSEADFLLTNALRKLLLDNDVDTGIALLKVADEVLEKVSDPRVVGVRTAINNDLKQLLSVNSVDQNTIMQQLSQLANTLDELPVLDVDFGSSEPQKDTKISDNVADWESNLEKSANSFLNHFIRVTPKNSDAQALLAPNQDIYLRENIRLRLQIAILAVPRQQHELYKQSLETAASWVRSYFDTSSEEVVSFLKTLDELAEQSIYVDVPDQLSSLNTLDKILNKPTAEVKKIEISADKALVEENQAATEKAKEEPTAPTDNQQPADKAAQPQ